MAEYNVQINKYNANNLGYDQLYPQPMKHADTHLLNGSDPINVGELGVSNPNLLDNWYFGNPIDQRGGYVVPPDTPYYSDTGLTTQAGTVSAYTTASPGNGTYGTITVSGTTYYVAWSAAVRGYTGTGYGIDRWKMPDNFTITITENGIELHKPANTGDIVWMQSLEPFLLKQLRGKTITLSCLTGTDELYFGTFNVQETGIFDGPNIVVGTDWIFDFVIDNAENSNGYFRFYSTSNAETSLKVKAAKLELGSQQTLAHQENGNWVLNEIPDYGEQLARCLRCAEKSCNMGTSVGSPETASPIIKVAYSKWGFCEPMVFFKVPKRAIPAVKIFSAKTGAEGMAYDETVMQDVAVTPSYVGQNSFTVQHASENLVTGHAYQFYYFATANL